MIPVIPHPTRTVVGAAGALALGPDSSVRAEEPVLAGIAQRFVDDVVDDTGLHLILGGGPSTSSIVLSLVASLSVVFPPPLGLSPDGGDPVNESYRLTVTATGVTVEALVPTGIVRGLATLRQLISASLTEDGTALLDEVLIDDSPRFAWRGLSLDVVRTFFSTEQLRRVLDAMALFKMNVLHLHLSDDQGWRIEIPRWPELTEAGAAGAMGNRPGGYYTHHEFAELVTYAADRSIVILPEIDMPGHSGAVLRARPGLPPPTLVDPNVVNRELPPQWSAYQPVWDIVQVVLRRVLPLTSSGRRTSLEVALKAWPLLETLLTRSLRAAAISASPIGLHLSAAEGRLQWPLLTPQDGGRGRFVEPDGVLFADDRVVATFEAKYTTKSIGKPAREHYFQALSTAAAFGSPTAVLAYPGKGEPRIWDVSGFSGTPERLCVTGLDLFSYRAGAGDIQRANDILELMRVVGASSLNLETVQAY